MQAGTCRKWTSAHAVAKNARMAWPRRPSSLDSNRLKRLAGEVVPLGRATRINLASPERTGRLREALAYWRFSGTPDLLDRRPITEVFPGIEALIASSQIVVGHPFELPLGERILVELIVQHLQPTVIVEFGTFTGTTTALMADTAPQDAIVHTFDLPGAPDDIVGSAFRDKVATSAKIVQHRADTRTFEFDDLIGQVDLVYVDASHHYVDVLTDSFRALELIGDSGVVLWDDYQAAQPGVVRAINEIGLETEVYRLAGSRLAVHQRIPHQAG